MNKSEAQIEIEKFFEGIRNKTPEEIKKIKKLANHYRIRLNDKKKLFCKKCFSPKLKIKKIKKNMKTIECLVCKNLSRWKIKKDDS